MKLTKHVLNPPEGVLFPGACPVENYFARPDTPLLAAGSFMICQAVVLLLFIALSVMTLSGCHKHSQTSNIDHYTCSMHQQIISDKPGECPICHMTLVPVYKEEQQTKQDKSETTKPSGVNISVEKQGLAGVQTTTVQKIKAVFTLRTFGTVAFDPELAVAQSEYLAAFKSSGELKAAAKNRLKLFGMSDAEIAELEKNQKVSENLYLPNNKTGLWVYATLYEGDYGLVKQGDSAQIEVPGGAQKKFTGTVRGVTPVVGADSRTLQARIYLSDNDIALKPNTYVNVFFEIDLGEQLVIPKSALLDTGKHKIVYKAHDRTLFSPQEIQTGAAWDEWLVINSGLNEGDTVASAALFLVDSEAQLKTGMSGEHNH